MKSFFKEFEKFINQGNVLDMAVGVIIGAAFKSVVDSLVNDILMPLISLFKGGMDFSEWAIPIGDSATINYGNFISVLLNFLIMAMVLFLIVKTMNRARELMWAKYEEENPEEKKEEKPEEKKETKKDKKK